jgi:CRISPR system Cascade subunit CasE
MIDIATTSAILTRIVVNPAHPRVQKDLRDINSMHQTVTRMGCPEDFGPSSRSAAGLLYRVDHSTAGVTLLIQSRTVIDPAKVSHGYAHGGTRDLEALLHRLEPGIRLRYKITANPTKSSKKAGSAARGVPRPLVGDEALMWWSRKAEEAGLDIETVNMIDTKKLTGSRSKDNHRIAITATTFEGTASVTSATSIGAAVLNGIGRGRAYGCGLLSVAPLY